MPVSVPGLPLSLNEADADLIQRAPSNEIEEDEEELIREESRNFGPNDDPLNHFVGWLTAKKGGPTSGNFGHAGIPGHLGGSAPGQGGASQAPISQGIQTSQGVLAQPQTVATQTQTQPQASMIKPKSQFDQELVKKPVPDRIAAWEAMTVEERDNQANAAQAIPAASRALLAKAGERPAFSGDVHMDIAQRLLATSYLTTKLGQSKIAKTVGEADRLLEKAGVKPQLRYQIGMEMADALTAQEHEAMTRQLGDHGIHHIQGNIQTSMAILEELPSGVSDRERASVYLTHIFHDTGYLTEPSRNFLDEGHARWSAEHFDQNLRPLIQKAVGARTAQNITNMIQTHASTGIDWESDPVGSAVRVADNLAVFHREKLPPLFRYVNGNLGALIQIHQGKIDLETGRNEMLKNIEASQHSPEVKAALSKAANEVSKITGKFTIGMLGGYVESISWTGSHIKIGLRRNKSQDLLNKMLDLNQANFAKFAKSYKIDPKQFLNDLNFKIPPEGGGRTLLEAEMLEHKELHVLYGKRP